MAEQKTKPTAASVAAFLASVPDEGRRAECTTLIEILRRASGEAPRMWGDSMVGFGSYHYRYASGHQGDCFLAGFAPRKKALTVYLMPGFARHGELLERLGKHKGGKGCLYFARLADVDLAVLEELARLSVEHLRATYPES